MTNWAVVYFTEGLCVIQVWITSSLKSCCRVVHPGTEQGGLVPNAVQLDTVHTVCSPQSACWATGNCRIFIRYVSVITARKYINIVWVAMLCYEYVLFLLESVLYKKKKLPWSESTSELYRPSDRRLSAKWLPTFADKGSHVVSVADPYGCILGFLDRSCYFSIK
jgi:hypothetical protein